MRAAVPKTRLGLTPRNIAKGVFMSRRLGAGYFLDLLSAYFVLPVVMAALPVYAMVYRRYRHLFRLLNLNREMSLWRSRKGEVLGVGRSGYWLHVNDLGLEPAELSNLKEHLRDQGEAVIADIDQDGLLLSRFGPIDSLPTASKQDFIARGRFTLQIVARDDKVLLRKQYRGNRLSFLSEIAALHRLASAGCNVPAIANLDFDGLSITMSYIAGRTLEEMLGQHGAVVRTRDIRNDAYFSSLSSEQIVESYPREGKRHLDSVVAPQFIEDLHSEVKRIHQAGVELYDIKYGNVIIEGKTGKPFLVDFESARTYPRPHGKTFTVIRDRDTEKFNLFFNTNKLTYTRLKSQIGRNDDQGIGELYAPVHFGNGLRAGHLWDVNVGYGRWYFILRDALPSLDGKRVLSLGANAGVNDIQMLRHGASEVIGVEKDERWIRQGRFFKEAFEWADNRSYSFDYVEADMADLPSMDLGKFHVAVALCSLYYLNDEDMVRVTQHISAIADTFVVQCNIRKDIGRPDPHSYEKASVEYASDLLRGAGFSELRLIAPKGYSRPIVIGTKG